MARRNTRDPKKSFSEEVNKEDVVMAEETAEQTKENDEEKLDEATPSEDIQGAAAENAEVENTSEEPVQSTAEEVIPEQEPEPEVQPEPTKKQVKVKVSQLNFRPDPNRISKPIRILNQGDVLDLIEDGKALPTGWIEVNFSNTTGYVMKEFVEQV